MAINEWHHIAATYDGSKMCLYLDGDLIGTTRVSASIRTNDFELGIGYCQENGNKLRGELAAARVYSKALTAEEVQLRYRADKGENVSAIGPEDASVVVWYDIDKEQLK